MNALDFMTIPGWIALISGLFIIGQLVVSLFFGELDVDVDGDADFDMSAIWSPKGLIHFLAGGSWYLVLIQTIRENGNWLYYDWLLAIIVGLVTTTLLALLYFGLSKLACEKKKEEGEELVGRTGRIYLNKGNGNYTISISISGSLSHIQVSSETKNDKLNFNDPVTITKYSDRIYFIS